MIPTNYLSVQSVTVYLWALKLFYKWVNGKPLFVIAHSDDFRWFG